MPEETPGVVADSPQPDVTPAPSAEDVSPQQTSQEAPASTSQPSADEQRVPYTRFQEVIREKEALRQQAQMLAETLQRVAPQPQAAPVNNPWAGLVDHPDAATAQFWQQQQKLLAYERDLARQEAVQELQPVINAGMQELARMTAKEFRRENPEVKPGSEDERLIIAYMNGQVDGVRHPVESAKRNAMYDKLETENRAFKGKQQSVSSKVAANASDSSSGMPPTAGLPQKPRSWQDNVRDAFRKGGDLSDIANAAGMRRT